MASDAERKFALDPNNVALVTLLQACGRSRDHCKQMDRREASYRERWPVNKKVNRQGRNTGESRHVRLYDWMMRSAAWQSLDVYERSLYVEFKARYNGSNNGDIAFSGDQMAKSLNCSNRPADRALRTLLDRGFVRLSQRGHFDWKSRSDGSSRSNTYILTEYPIDWPAHSAMPATKDFMKWHP